MAEKSPENKAKPSALETTKRTPNAATARAIGSIALNGGKKR